MRTRALDGRAARLSDKPLEEDDIDDDTEVVGIIDTCKLCQRTFTAKQIDEVFCPECERKSQSKKDFFFKDAQTGLGIRLGPRAAVPRKIGGTWSGGGIEQRGRQAYDDYRIKKEIMERDDDPLDINSQAILEKLQIKPTDRNILNQKVNGRQVA